MMFSEVHDTICAVSTPAGVGGIAVIRVSGPDAVGIVDRVWRGKRLADAVSHTAHLGEVVDESGEVIDQAVATLFRAPRSYTGEDVVELSVHGSSWIQREVVNLLVRSGARVALPGEYTRRAYASGRMDLAEAEGVADVIASTSRAAHRLAVSQMKGDFSRCLAQLRGRLLELASLLELELDFSEEEVEFASREKLHRLAVDIDHEVSRLSASFATGAAIKEGVPVVIVGATNAGKSTLLNRLSGDDRAIVSDVHGTTRDVIEEMVDIDGVRFRLIDTAGLRDTDDIVESLGIGRTVGQIERAAIVVWVIGIDSTDEEIADIWNRIVPHLPDDTRLIVAWNKCDLDPDRATAALQHRLNIPTVTDTTATTPASATTDIAATSGLPVSVIPGLAATAIGISASTGLGIDKLKEMMFEASGIAEWQDTVVVTNARHYEALAKAGEAIARVIDGLKQGLSGDFIAQDVRQTLHYLGEITGEITTDDILGTIFSHFCIGK